MPFDLLLRLRDRDMPFGVVDPIDQMKAQILHAEGLVHVAGRNGQGDTGVMAAISIVNITPKGWARISRARGLMGASGTETRMAVGSSEHAVGPAHTEEKA